MALAAVPELITRVTSTADRRMSGTSHSARAARRSRAGAAGPGAGHGTAASSAADSTNVAALNHNAPAVPRVGDQHPADRRPEQQRRVGRHSGQSVHGRDLRLGHQRRAHRRRDRLGRRRGQPGHEHQHQQHRQRHPDRSQPERRRPHQVAGTSTVRRDIRSAKLDSSWPGPTQASRPTAVTSPAAVAEPVSSYTSTVSASRAAQSPSS